MKLLIDMNLSPRWLGVLEAAGFEALHGSDVGPLDAPNAESMSFARNGDLVVLTHDLDFGAILAVTHGAKPSVVQRRADDVSPEVAAAVVIAALSGPVRRPRTGRPGGGRRCPRPHPLAAVKWDIAIPWPPGRYG
jgi:predicted nuclease of predicted toxin-antitoxin system